MVTQRKYPGDYCILLQLKTHQIIAELLTLSENTGSPRPRESSLFWKFWLKFWSEKFWSELQNMLQPNTGNVSRWRLTHISPFVDSNSIPWQRDLRILATPFLSSWVNIDAGDDTHAQQSSEGGGTPRTSGSGTLAGTSEAWDIFDSLQKYTFNVDIFLFYYKCTIIYFSSNILVHNHFVQALDGT